MAKQANELEVACAIAKFYELQPTEKKNFKMAIQQAASSRPACLSYIKYVGDFVQAFGGGQGFPLLMILQSISCLAILIGLVFGPCSLPHPYLFADQVSGLATP